MDLFYTPEDPKDFLLLNEEESKHLIKVLRFDTGDEVQLTNGKGTLYTAVIELADQRKCLLKITSHKEHFGKKDYSVHIGIAPTKNIDRLEWFLEKATEIGIDEITPILCTRSERKEIKTDRLNKVLISAMKQSGRTYLPKLNQAKAFPRALETMIGEQQFICTMNTNDQLKELYSKSKDAIILIGPEGDFHPDEIELAKQHGFKEASLGNSRLRTETAGVVSCTIVSFLNQ